MKRPLLSIFASVFLGYFIFSSIQVSALQTGFSITANSSYSAKSTENLKMDHALQAYVNWQTSSHSSHKEWFQVVNSNSEIRSESVLFSYLGAGFIPEYSSCMYGYYYYLRARREHITNPTTTVKGIWES